MDNTKPSALLDKFVVRFNNPGLRDRIKDRAKADHRSMNDVLNFATERYLQGAEAFDRLLKLVENSMKPTGPDSYIPVKKNTLLALYDAAERGRRLSPDSAPMVAVSTLLDMQQTVSGIPVRVDKNMPDGLVRFITGESSHD